MDSVNRGIDRILFPTKEQNIPRLSNRFRFHFQIGLHFLKHSVYWLAIQTDHSSAVKRWPFWGERSAQSHLILDLHTMLVQNFRHILKYTTFYYHATRIPHCILLCVISVFFVARGTVAEWQKWAIFGHQHFVINIPLRDKTGGSRWLIYDMVGSLLWKFQTESLHW